MFIFLLLGIASALTSCFQDSVLGSGVFIGYNDDEEQTQANNASALQILQFYKTWLNLAPERQSFKAQAGDLTGFMWVGSMVENSGISDNIVSDFINDIEVFGMPTEIYYEFRHNNPLESFGIILTTRGLEKAQKAVKNWSSGQKYDEATKTRATGPLTICYLDYEDRKPEINDPEAGDCYVNVQSGEEAPHGNSPEYLKAFNPSLNLTGLQDGQPYCYSEGNLPGAKISA